MADELKHYGILGMKWGIRKEGSSSGISFHNPITALKEKYKAADSADHKAYTQARRKKLHTMTTDEVKTVVKRMELLHEYRHTNSFLKPNKFVRSMTNAELETANKKSKLYKEGKRWGFKKIREIRSMDRKAVDQALKRVNLEKKYRELQGKNFDALHEVAKFFISDHMEYPQIKLKKDAFK